MSGTIPEKSMLDLALKKDPVARNAAEAPDAGGGKTDKGKFNGFLQAFLDSDRSRTKTRTPGADRSAPNSWMPAGSPEKGLEPWGRERPRVAKAAEKIRIREQAALRKALAKTVDDEECLDEQCDAAAKAAEEAAQLIRNILFPDDAGRSAPGGGEEAPQSWSRLTEAASLLAVETERGDPLASLGAAGMAGEELAAAMDTTNISAEMNIDAVLAALEELLDGMPRQALQQALDKATGGEAVNLDELAAALGLDSLEYSASGGQTIDLLARLDTGGLVIAHSEESAGLDAQAGVNAAGPWHAPAEGSRNGDLGDPLAAWPNLDGVASENSGGEEEATRLWSRLTEAASQLAVEAERGGDPLASLGASDMSGEDLAAAIDTANAGAETNIDAVPATLAEDGFITAEPGKNTANASVETNIDAVPATPAKDSFVAAEPGKNTANASADMNIDAVQTAFVEDDSTVAEPEKNAVPETHGDGINADLEHILTEAANDGRRGDSLAAWLRNNGIVSDDGMLRGNDITPQSLLTQLDAHLGAQGRGMPAEEFRSFLTLMANVENLLHEESGGTTSEHGAMALEAAGHGGSADMAGAVKARVPGSASSPMLDQIANIERLGELVKLANRRTAHNLTMQLSPPELGKVTVSVESKNGAVTALFRVEQADAASQLQNGMQQLRESLKAQGIDLVHVEVRQEGFEGGGGGGGRHGDAREPKGSGSVPRSAGGAEPEREDGGSGRGFNANGTLSLFA